MRGTQCHKQLPFGDGLYNAACSTYKMVMTWGWFMVHYHWVYHIKLELYHQHSSAILTITMCIYPGSKWWVCSTWSSLWQWKSWSPWWSTQHDHYQHHHYHGHHLHHHQRQHYHHHAELFGSWGLAWLPVQWGWTKAEHAGRGLLPCRNQTW